METTGSKKQPHAAKKEKTRSITYRLPASVVEELESEAAERNISQNVLVRQILERYMEWDRFGDKIGLVPVPKKVLAVLGRDMEGTDIDGIIGALVPIIKDSVLFMRGSFDLKTCISTLESYMKASGIKSDHRIEGSMHRFIIQHELGMKWSLLTEQLLKEIFHTFEPDKNIEFQTTMNTVIASIPLGSDFDEHKN